MKRIEFIAPVEAMRGNLSGAQNLKYPTQDNKAYDGPLGNINYARNYTPRFVGAKIAASGHKYFTTRTKSANHLTAASKKAMALMGAAGAMYANLVYDKTSTVYTGIRNQWLAVQGLGDKRTFRKYVMDHFRNMLETKQSQHSFSGPATLMTVQNPWVSTLTLNVTVSNVVLAKFWDILASGQPFYFKVETEIGVAKIGDDFGELIASSYNVLGLTTKTVSSNTYVGRGSSSDFTYLLNADGGYQMTNSNITEQVYKWTTVAP